MIRIAEKYSDTNGNSHTVRSVLCIIVNFLMPFVFEMLFFRAFRFSTRK
jgi:hypothetical protein